jgi:pimeloyl-ACP methyl ester carboxylesterase
MHIGRTAMRATAYVALMVSAAACGSEAPIAAVPDADVAEALWAPCTGDDAPGEPFECATIEVPVDYRSPEGEMIDLALVRIPASGESRRGVILTNPGGPGGSGFDFLVDSGEDLLSKTELWDFDIVGFDPRGVIRSGGLRCLDDAEWDELLYYDETPDNDAEQAIFDKWDADESTCEDRLGSSIRHYSTEFTARDMDLIRAAMRVDQIHYLGISYGTYLGGVYATLFPDRVAGVLLDSAFDPQGEEPGESLLTQMKGFEDAFGNWVKWCESDESCEFGPDDVAARWDSLYERLDAESLTTESGRDVNHEVLREATVASLYSDSMWPELASALATAEDGDGSDLMWIADWFNGRDEDGAYDGSSDAFYIIRCASGFEEQAPDDPAALVTRIQEAAPRFSRGLKAEDFDESGCEDAFDGQRLTEISFSGSAPVVVIGGENDPATPMRWAEEMATNMGSAAVLVRYTGEGHGHILSSRCVAEVANALFAEGEVPASGTVCEPDGVVGEPDWWSGIPAAAFIGQELDTDAVSAWLGIEPTLGYFVHGAVGGSARDAYASMWEVLTDAGFLYECDPDDPPVDEPCFFEGATSEQQFGVLMSEISDTDDLPFSWPLGGTGWLVSVFYIP